MPSFKYEGHLASGKAVSGSIEATNQEDAGQMLRAEGVFVRKVSEGDLNMVYDHSPKKRGDDTMKVYDPDSVAEPAAPRSAPPPKKVEEPKAEEAKADESYDKWREGLCKNLLAVESAKKELKQYGNMLKGSGKTKKEQEASRKKKIEKFEKQIDDACTMALAMAIHDSVKLLKDV